MSRLEELIQELCPNGVEFKSVEELFYFKNGKGHEQSIDPFGDYIVVNSKFISSDCQVLKKCSKQIEPVYIDDILMVMSDLPNGRALGKCFLVDENDKYSLNQRICSLQLKDKQKNLARFYYYVLNRNAQLLRYDNGVDQTNLKKEHITNIRIPVPPREVQCEIVHILDQFTLLTVELTTELTARRKQYDYYVDYLFSKKISGKIVKLSDLATFSQGLQVDVDLQKNEPFDGSIRFLRIVDFVNYNEPPRYIEKPSEKYIKKDGELIMIRYGASAAGKVFINYSGAIANNMFKINIFSNEVLTKYLYYFLAQRKIYEMLNHAGGGSTMPAINFKMVSDIDIFIPSIPEQEKIVSTIETLNKYSFDLDCGLPAEIELRKKQYEYYRDKLLSFKELK